MSKYTDLGVSYYSLLGLHPKASNQQIRRAYRKLSKQYHPDTTDMPRLTATAKFQQINEAYATLVDSKKRLEYDKKIKHLYLNDFEQRVNFNAHCASGSQWRNLSSYLDNKDRPLSAGELFVLLIMGITLLGCLIIAIIIGLMRPELTIQPIKPPVI
ncbi:MAG: J domain-containing protein [Trichodesmium sp. St16_bin2-tuft]|jgi:curved DNA-binding protein CbpA|nr:J domain-containing protein [Trichodesmium sp. MAG_R02]MDE5085886.1 J domain-containing protein [Trichodesmium sp. St16_bin2-tuft]